MSDRRRGRAVNGRPVAGRSPALGSRQHLQQVTEHPVLSYDDGHESSSPDLGVAQPMDTTADIQPGVRPRPYPPRGGRGGRGQVRGRPHGPPRYPDHRQYDNRPSGGLHEPYQQPTQDPTLPGGFNQNTWFPRPPPQSQYHPRHEDGYNPSAASTGFYPQQQQQQQQQQQPPLHLQVPGFGFGMSSGHPQQFVAPHINPRFASQFGIPQMQMPAHNGQGYQYPGTHPGMSRTCL
ncbi:hypothetical protein BKA62DRAFT_242732 [Auriculariales sp. MPI-PUGE-AT-0066]|nr:hypothetical protein BKA62DRAFT_242732 [Auriculariales sp. MPI-PUGE-AT-0066]